MALDINYSNPLETDTHDEIIWHNLEQADKYHHLLTFIYAVNAWIKEYKDKDYYDLEIELRKRDFHTHLIAKEPKNLRPDMKLGIFGRNNKEYKYECIFSCREKEAALKELLESSNSYEENLEKLKISGSIILDDTLNQDLGNDSYIPNKHEKTNGELIEECKKKIYFREISADEIITQIFNKCKEQYGKGPETVVYGMDKDGPVYGFIINNKLVSNVGYKIIYNNGDRNAEIVKLC